MFMAGANYWNMERDKEFAKEAGSVPARFTSLVSFGGLVVIGLSISLITLFLVHQTTLWISLDPETAFHGAKVIVKAYATGWNTVKSLWNPAVEVLLVAIPGYNAYVEYWLMPQYFTILDILSVAFTRRPYGGVISEEFIPYDGYMCPEDGTVDQTSEWCGKLAFYSNQLGVAAGSTSSFISNSTVVLSTQTARRLSELTGEPIIGSLDLSPLLDAIQAILGAGIVLAGTLSDVVFHVAWTVLSEVFEVLFNLFITVIKALSGLVVMVIRSGLLQSLIKTGLDLIVVVITEIMIPYYMAQVNAVMCILDLFQVGGWMTQLDCSKLRSNSYTPRPVSCTVLRFSNSSAHLLSRGERHVCGGVSHLLQHCSHRERNTERLRAALQPQHGQKLLFFLVWRSRPAGGGHWLYWYPAVSRVRGLLQLQGALLSYNTHAVSNAHPSHPRPRRFQSSDRCSCSLAPSTAARSTAKSLRAK